MQASPQKFFSCTAPTLYRLILGRMMVCLKHACAVSSLIPHGDLSGGKVPLRYCRSLVVLSTLSTLTGITAMQPCVRISKPRVGLLRLMDGSAATTTQVQIRPVSSSRSTSYSVCRCTFSVIPIFCVDHTHEYQRPPYCADRCTGSASRNQIGFAERTREGAEEGRRRL